MNHNPVQLSLDDKFRFRCHKGIARYQERKAQSLSNRAAELADAQDKIYESLGD